MNKEELIARRDVLRKELAEILPKITAFELEEFVAKSPFKVGDRVIHYMKEYEITRIKTKFSSFRFVGKLITKSGALGVKEFDLYGTITPATSKAKDEVK